MYEQGAVSPGNTKVPELGARGAPSSAASVAVTVHNGQLPRYVCVFKGYFRVSLGEICRVGGGDLHMSFI